MKYYDVDSTVVWLILDEMETLLSGDQLFIFQSLRKGVGRREIAELLEISNHALRNRIYIIRKKIRSRYHELCLPKLFKLEDIF